MKICLVQLEAITGDIPANIQKHKQVIEMAAQHGATVIVFPELSLTGYEPGLAGELVVDLSDSRLNDLQQLSNEWQVLIGAGAPTKGPCISLLLFQPEQPIQVYSKKYLHADELPFFVAGENISCLTINGEKLSPAICYELSVPEHAATAYRHGAGIYVSSVAKTADGVARAMDSLSGIARQYNMTTLMANCTGYCDNFQSAGQSAVWNTRGELVARLNDCDEGILIYDTLTAEVLQKSLAEKC